MTIDTLTIKQAEELVNKKKFEYAGFGYDNKFILSEGEITYIKNSKQNGYYLISGNSDPLKLVRESLAIKK